MVSGSEASRFGILFSEFSGSTNLSSSSKSPSSKRMGGKALALPPPCPWVFLKILQSYETSLLQELGHFLLHLVSLR